MRKSRRSKSPRRLPKSPRRLPKSPRRLPKSPRRPRISRRDLKEAKAEIISLVGKSNYNIARNEFVGRTKIGRDTFRKAEKALSQRKAEIRVRNRDRVSKYRAGLLKKGMAPKDVARALPKSVQFKRVPFVLYRKIRRGPYAGQYMRIADRQKPQRFTAKRAESRIKHEKYDDRIRGLANKLQITKTDAKGLYKFVRQQAIADLRAFKKSKTFKNYSPRRKKAYSERRWARMATGRLFNLLEIDYNS